MSVFASPQRVPKLRQTVKASRSGNNETPSLSKRSGVVEFSPSSGPLFGFVTTLCHRLCFYQELTGKQQKEARSTSKKYLKKLNKWAKHCPENFLHKWHLVKAEFERISNKDAEAISHYQKAASLAQKEGFVNEQAIATERYAMHLKAKGEDSLFKEKMEEAIELYRSWGATAKVVEMERSHAER